MTDIYTDLLQAQKEIEAVSKDGNNPFFKSDYTSLNATILACKEVLNKHNFAVLQPMESDENGVYVCTTLIHSSGKPITSKMRIVPSKANDPQSQGSAITYARRYSLKSLLCMSDADDDGEKAMARNTPTQTTQSVRASVLATPKQVNAIYKMAKSAGKDILILEKEQGSVEEWDASKASAYIKFLSSEIDKKKAK
ncbi:MAG: hypothetical protein DRP97_00480 [Candidatus Latescibacterota bacterium]|nr:MAG: hypothetical protein DRP97_00480 [Candidatus Latescibacterota bacterium]